MHILTKIFHDNDEFNFYTQFSKKTIIFRLNLSFFNIVIIFMTLLYVLLPRLKLSEDGPPKLQILEEYFKYFKLIIV
jgi:hypothetical protein